MKVRKKLVNEYFDLLRDWCEWRNELIHTCLNKRIAALGEDLFERALEGMEIARFLDLQV